MKTCAQKYIRKHQLVHIGKNLHNNQLIPLQIESPKLKNLHNHRLAHLDSVQIYFDKEKTNATKTKLLNGMDGISTSPITIPFLSYGTLYLHNLR